MVFIHFSTICLVTKHGWENIFCDQKNYKLIKLLLKLRLINLNKQLKNNRLGTYDQDVLSREDMHTRETLTTKYMNIVHFD